jgi:ubiquinone/menaquinone biosynthesis C-methylase UbiE
MFHFRRRVHRECPYIFSARFDHVDAQKDPAYFVKFLDGRKSIPLDAPTKRQMIDWLQPLEGKRMLDVGRGSGDD